MTRRAAPSDSDAGASRFQKRAQHWAFGDWPLGLFRCPVCLLAVGRRASQWQSAGNMSVRRQQVRAARAGAGCPAANATVSGQREARRLSRPPQPSSSRAAATLQPPIHHYSYLFTQPAPQGRPSRFSSHRKGAGLPHPITEL